MTIIVIDSDMEAFDLSRITEHSCGGSGLEVRRRTSVTRECKLAMWEHLALHPANLSLWCRHLSCNHKPYQNVCCSGHLLEPLLSETVRVNVFGSVVMFVVLSHLKIILLCFYQCCWCCWSSWEWRRSGRLKQTCYRLHPSNLGLVSAGITEPVVVAALHYT